MPPSNQLALKLSRAKTLSIEEIQDRSQSPLSEINSNRDGNSLNSIRGGNSNSLDSNLKKAGSRTAAPFPMNDMSDVTPRPVGKKTATTTKKVKSFQEFPTIPDVPVIGGPSAVKPNNKGKEREMNKEKEKIKGKERPKEKERTTERERPKEKEKEKIAPRAFPLDVRQKTKSFKRRSSGRIIVESDEEDDEDPLTLRDRDELVTFNNKPRPFPMALSLLSSSPGKAAAKSKRNVEETDSERASKRSRPYVLFPFVVEEMLTRLQDPLNLRLNCS